MKILRPTLLALLGFLASVVPLSAYPLVYAEDFYELYHRHLVQSTDDLAESLIWLEHALTSDFRNPLYALARIETKEEWRRYRELFLMHVNLEMVKVYRTIGSKYQKMRAYFYNYPWKRQNLESLDTAESYYRQGYIYWEQAEQHAIEAWRLRSEHLDEIQSWETEDYRVMTGDLDYRRILDRDLAKIDKVRQEFLAMGEGTY